MAAKIIQSVLHLVRILRPLRGSKKIVFTNGCFDILHRGHVEYLAKARSFGHVLVLGLNSDDSVRRIKGPDRPVVPLADRAAVLAALEAVDYIVPFSEDTPLNLIMAIRPDILVKGSDWKESEIAGANVVRIYGGRVARVQLTPGRSTTSVIGKIKAILHPFHSPLLIPGTESPPTLVVIPARYGSTRFVGKALAPLGGRPVIQHVYEKAREAAQPNWKIVIATDDRRILKSARSFGAQAMMTSKRCKSGSDRCAEVAQNFPGYPVVVNLQGDEPFQPPANIRMAVRTLLSSSCPVATLAAICPPKDLKNPNVAKVAVSAGRAIYFSRGRIPFYRDIRTLGQMTFYKHIGLYVFRREFLIEFSRWPETPLERAEKLEQLRVLENDHSIAVAVTAHDSIGIDTPADLARAQRLILVSQPR